MSEFQELAKKVVEEHRGQWTERDPMRRKLLLLLLEAYWDKNNDMRLGQIVSNMNGRVSFQRTRDVFYLRDEDLIEQLKRELRA